MTLQAITQSNKSNLLRRTLQADAIFSALSGLVLTAGAGPLTKFAGLETPLILTIMGAGSLLYAASIFYNIRQPFISPAFAWFTIIGNTIWVLASLVILFAGLPLTSPAWWAIAIAADIVAVFAVLQYLGLRRM